MQLSIVLVVNEMEKTKVQDVLDRNDHEESDHKFTDHCA